MKRFLPIVLVTVVLSACSGIQSGSDATDVSSTTKLQVSASFYPLAFLSERIAGDAAVVTQVIPSGAEPHDYEPSPQELTAVYESKILIMNGQGLDPWADQSRDQLEKNGVTVVAATESADLIAATEKGHHEEGHHEEGHHEVGEFDPHVWLDPVQMKSIAERIRDAFIAADPANEEKYRANTDALLSDLTKLDEHFRSQLTSCKQNKVIVSHNAFGYMAKQYNFDTVALAGISPDEEPSPKKIAEIIEIVKREKLPVVFFETLVSPKLAESVANGAGATTLVLNPLEGLTPDDVASGKTYLTVMRTNADNLATALECQK